MKVTARESKLISWGPEQTVVTLHWPVAVADGFHHDNLFSFPPFVNIWSIILAMDPNIYLYHILPDAQTGRKGLVAAVCRYVI